VPACDVSGCVHKSGPSEAFFKDLEKRCPNLRRLHLSKADLTVPLPAIVEFLSLSESSLSPTALSAFRFRAAEEQTVTWSRLRELELVSMELSRGALAAVPASVKKLMIKGTRLPRESFERLAQSKAGGHETASRLKEIDLSDSTELTDVEVDYITTAWPRITTLKLNGCFNTTFQSFPLFMRILHTLHRADRLEILEANGVPLTRDNIVFMCQFIGGRLRRLSIAGCQSAVA